MDGSPVTSSWFRRILLPGLAFKAVVIGGGYATGRELVEFFLGSGPRGGLAGMCLAMGTWSLVCAVAFLFARAVNAYDYRSFFTAMFGRFWLAFEVPYLLFLVLILAVLTAAAGTIASAVLGLPPFAGALLLAAGIVGITTFGNLAAEMLFRNASILIYLTYAAFLVLALLSFGPRIVPAFQAHPEVDGWASGGIRYASYNVVAVVAVLPFVRFMSSSRDALVAGMLSGPIAMLPALLFFICMTAFYPAIGMEALPSDYLLRQMHAPWFRIVYQLMIFCALLETGVGVVNAFNERISQARLARGRDSLSPVGRMVISAALLLGSAHVAGRIGLIDLIARGYGAFGYIMLAVFVLPLLFIGLRRLVAGGFPVASARSN